MSDIPGPSALAIMDENSNKENMDIFYEPEKKKVKVEEKEKEKNALEYRLSGILCCAVCLDLPKTCYQVCIFCFIRIIYFRLNLLILVSSILITSINMSFTDRILHHSHIWSCLQTNMQKIYLERNFYTLATIWHETEILIYWNMNVARTNAIEYESICSGICPNTFVKTSCDLHVDPNCLWHWRIAWSHDQHNQLSSWQTATSFNMHMYHIWFHIIWMKYHGSKSICNSSMHEVHPHNMTAK